MRRHWLTFAALLAAALVVALVVGNTPASRLALQREGKLLGTSAVGEWAELGAYGLKLRVDEVAIAEELPTSTGMTGGLDGLLLARVRVTLQPTIDIDARNSFEMLSCRTTLQTASGEQITASPVILEGPTDSDCGALPSPLRAGEQVQYQTVFQIRPADQAGLKVRVHWRDSPLVGEPAPVWEFEV